MGNVSGLLQVRTKPTIQASLLEKRGQPERLPRSSQANRLGVGREYPFHIEDDSL